MSDELDEILLNRPWVVLVAYQVGDTTHRIYGGPFNTKGGAYRWKRRMDSEFPTASTDVVPCISRRDVERLIRRTFRMVDDG